MMVKVILLFQFFGFAFLFPLNAQELPVMIKVKPVEIQTVLNNPGIGFTTFQRFNGDTLNAGERWTEGFPIAYQKFNGDLRNVNYPQTTIAYFRVDWAFVETAPGFYNWAMIDKALRTAMERGQTLMFRIAPFEEGAKDVPAWYRKMVGPENNNRSGKWRIDPEDPRYLRYFGGMIRALGQRYDGHPGLESIDISIVGYWGEGDGSHLLSDHTRIDLLNVYLDNFHKTHLTFQPLNGDAPDPGVLVNGTSIEASWADGRKNGTRPVGYRCDCLGDMTTDLWPDKHWSHMTDIYPKDIVKSGMAEAWKKEPVTMEICYTFLHWLDSLKYDEKTVDYIFKEALKWHISSFNAKSSPVPKVWGPLVDKWLNKMGYRFVLRRFEFPAVVTGNGQLNVTSLWENVGVAPVYRDYQLAFRLKSEKTSALLITNAPLRNWLPGDIVYDEHLYIPPDLSAGKYQLQTAIISPDTHSPVIRLAIEGVQPDGWYPLGEITVQQPR